MIKRKIGIVIISCLVSVISFAQQFAISGTVRLGNEPSVNARVILMPDSIKKLSNENGFFRFAKLAPGNYKIKIIVTGYEEYEENIILTDKNISLDIILRSKTVILSDVIIKTRKNESVSGKLGDVSGTAIYAGKKTEVINMRNINANLATNNTRQIYARVPGLNIWENDGGGLQLAIGGRGLNPNRSSNINVRENGYEISADALGYPESYYTPSTEGVDRIEIIRGAASLQYGPHFGGLVNFIMKEGPKEKPMEITTRQTLGSFGFFNSFNSIGGTIAKGKLNYYSFYQYKRGDDWRPNSHFDQHNAYLHTAYQVTPKLKITGQYTLMRYLAQQPGGLTDEQFNEDPSVSVRARNWFKVDWNLFSLSLDYKFNEDTKLNWRNYTLQGGRQALGILTYINRPDHGGDRDLLADRYSNFGSELRLIHQYKFSKGQQNTLLLGARLYKGLTKRDQGDGSDGSDADFTFNGPEPNESSYRFPGTNVAVFAENIFQLNKHWNITPGVRVEYINTKSDGYYYKQNMFIPDEKIVEKNSDPRGFALLGIGTSWKFNSGTELYANISKNYKSVNFNDLRVVNQNAKVDPALKDETGFNLDLGFRGTYKSWLYIDMSLFYLKYNDRIGSIFTSDTNYMLYRLRTNVSDSRNYGLEAILEGDIIKALSKGRSKYKLNIYTNFSLIDGRYVNTKNTAIEGKLVENVPPVLFRTGLSFGNHRFNITCQYSYQAKQYSEATNTEYTPTAVDGVIPSFSVMDLSMSYNWRKFTLYAGINNLLDEKYFTRRADGYPGPGIIPANPRNVYTTLQFRL